MRCFLVLTGLFGIIFGLAGTVLIPVAAVAGWQCDPAVPIMLIVSFALLLAASHCMDRTDRARRQAFNKSL